jgi:hypothetical protein
MLWVTAKNYSLSTFSKRKSPHVTYPHPKEWGITAT